MLTTPQTGCSVHGGARRPLATLPGMAWSSPHLATLLRDRCIAFLHEAWLGAVSLSVGFLFAAFAAAVVLLLAALSIATAPLLLLLPFPLLPLGAFAAARGFASWHRARLAAYLGKSPMTPRPPTGSGHWSRLGATFRDVESWKQVAYHVLFYPLFISIAFCLVISLLGAGLTYSTIYLHGYLLPDPKLLSGQLTREELFGAYTGVGVALLLLALVLARGFAAVDFAFSRLMLSPAQDHRIAELTQARIAAVEAADAERRRIERDLHDGAQQRLVSLAMNLGMSKAALGPDVDPATREALTQAHDEAKMALTEMRDFVRGLHPAVLEDRGLDAALSGLVARSPVPVDLRVHVEERPSATVEAVAYFVVAEALTNIAKHSGANHAYIMVKRANDVLRIRVMDDGRGGADPRSGTGLHGLAMRVASVEGTVNVDSPEGGPTTIQVELPCG